jgi:hypothetical protein
MENTKTMMVGTSLMLRHKGKAYQTVIENDEERHNFYEELEDAIGEEDDALVEELIDCIFPALFTTEEETLAENVESTEEISKMISWYRQVDFKAEISDEGSLQLLGIPISVPDFLAKHIYKMSKRGMDYNPALNFWRLCSLNPDPRARDDLFQFLKGGKFTITPSGYFIAYRNVDIMEKGDERRTKWVTDQFVYAKRKKRSTTNLYVLEDQSKDSSDSDRFTIIEPDEYYINVEEKYANMTLLGTLGDVYKALPDMGDKTTIYTDRHSHTFKIKIGELVEMNRHSCDNDPRRDCSYGLHVGNKDFLTRGYYGGVGIAVLIDPSKVVAVPQHNPNKMRVCEYFPISIIEYDSDGKVIEIDTAIFEHGYTQYSVGQIDRMIKSAEIEELQEQLIIPEGFTMDMFEDHKLSLADMMEVIRERVVKVN